MTLMISDLYWTNRHIFNPLCSKPLSILLPLSRGYCFAPLFVWNQLLPLSISLPSPLLWYLFLKSFLLLPVYLFSFPFFSFPTLSSCLSSPPPSIPFPVVYPLFSSRIFCFPFLSFSFHVASLLFFSPYHCPLSFSPSTLMFVFYFLQMFSFCFSLP